jgi:hypothetical protein
MISTEYILVTRELNRMNSQAIVEWAIGLVQEGRSGDYLCILAFLTPPFNSHELATYRDQVLWEQKLDRGDIGSEAARTSLAVELFRAALRQGEDLAFALGSVAEIYIEDGYQPNLVDFYVLHNAFKDIEAQGYQHYWEGATSENIQQIVAERVRVFLEGNSYA